MNTRLHTEEGIAAVSVNVLVENKSTNEIGIDWASFKIKDQDDNGLMHPYA